MTTRTDRRRFPILFAAITALVLAGGGGGGGGGLPGAGAGG